MKQRAVIILGKLPMSRERVIRLVNAANAFHSQITLESSSAVINGKSMLGLLSIMGSTGRTFALVARGEDEQEAIRALAALFEEQEEPKAP